MKTPRTSRELTAWFAALPKLAQPERYLAGLTRGLHLVGARNLRVPGAEQAFARLLASGTEAAQRNAWEASRYFELTALIQRARQDAAAVKSANRHPSPSGALLRG